MRLAGDGDGRTQQQRFQRYDWLPIPPLMGDSELGSECQWPLRSYLDFGALPGAVPCARLHVRELLWEWELARRSDAAELVASELVTNAVQASRPAWPPAPVRLGLRSDGSRILVMVWDASSQPPVRMDARGDAENGRGLLLVETFSTRWDWYFPPQHGGKVVWALISAD